MEVCPVRQLSELWALGCRPLMRLVVEVSLQQEPLGHSIHQVVVSQWAEPPPTVLGPPLRPPLQACSPVGTAPRHRMSGMLEALLREQLMHCSAALLVVHLMELVIPGSALPVAPLIRSQVMLIQPGQPVWARTFRGMSLRGMVASVASRATVAASEEASVNRTQVSARLVGSARFFREEAILFRQARHCGEQSWAVQPLEVGATALRHLLVLPLLVLSDGLRLRRLRPRAMGEVVLCLRLPPFRLGLLLLLAWEVALQAEVGLASTLLRLPLQQEVIQVTTYGCRGGHCCVPS